MVLKKVMRKLNRAGLGLALIGTAMYAGGCGVKSIGADLLSAYLTSGGGSPGSLANIGQLLGFGT